MPSGSRPYRHVFTGGLATNLGTTIESGEGARIDLAFLLRAENIYFNLAGGIRKIGGTSKYNSSVLGSGSDEIRGMYEYIRQGTSGAPARKRIAVVGTTIKKDDNDGSFSNIFTGAVDDTVPCFAVFEDKLLIATSGDEAPREYDQTTATTLGGTPPHFAFMVVHANRVWAGGDPAAPSRLFYSGLLDDEDWNGATNSGHLDIDPDDGDVLTGLAVFRGELIAFKGPNIGSIHRIQGLEPADFERKVFSHGVAAAGHNLIFQLPSDVGFVAQDGSIRSLATTDEFGDYRTSSLSLEIEDLLRTINFTTLRRGWAVTDSLSGYVLFALPVDAASVPNLLLMMDVRFDRPRFAEWPAINASSLWIMSDASSANRLIAYAGGSDGFIRKLQQNTRTIDDNTAIAAFAQTPYIDYATPLYRKTLRGVGLTIEPKGDYTITVGGRHRAIWTANLAQGGGAILGEFVLGTDTLGGSDGPSVWAEVKTCGEFRSQSYEISNIMLGEDFEVHALHAVLEISAAENYG